jgi:hypothetical protein
MNLSKIDQQKQNIWFPNYKFNLLCYIDLDYHELPQTHYGTKRKWNEEDSITVPPSKKQKTNGTDYINAKEKKKQKAKEKKKRKKLLAKSGQVKKDLNSHNFESGEMENFTVTVDFDQNEKTQASQNSYLAKKKKNKKNKKKSEALGDGLGFQNTNSGRVFNIKGMPCFVKNALSKSGLSEESKVKQSYKKKKVKVHSEALEGIVGNSEKNWHQEVDFPRDSLVIQEVKGRMGIKEKPQRKMKNRKRKKGG